MAVLKFNVSRDDSIYEAFPDLVQTKSGKLICVFNECEHHLDRTNARVMITESLDRGRSWSPKKPISEPGSRKSFLDCPQISLLSDGTMLIVCTMVTYHENGRSAEQYLWRGDSEGEHFEGPEVQPFCGIVPDKIQELSTGRILLAAHFEADEPQGKLRQYLWYSDDHGKTWSDRVTVAADPRYNLCEISILEMHDGTLVGFLREDQLKETERKNQRCRIMPLDYDRNPSPDLGYTGWTQFSDGEIYVVNYIKDDADKAFIRGYSFYPEDIELPVTERTSRNVF